MIYENMVRYAQTVHLSCTDTNTVSKGPKRLSLKDQNEIPHDPRHLGVPLGASKMIFEYDRHKPSNYLASRLALSLSGLNRAST
jgi:hypothetical protein